MPNNPIKIENATHGISSLIAADQSPLTQIIGIRGAIESQQLELKSRQLSQSNQAVAQDLTKAAELIRVNTFAYAARRGQIDLVVNTFTRTQKIIELLSYQELSAVRLNLKDVLFNNPTNLK